MIFDVDGTLVDSNDAHARAWVQAFAEHEIRVAYEPVRRAIGMGGDKLMPRVSGIEEDSERGQAIAARRAEIFQTDFLPSLRAFPGTRELVARLKDDGYTLAVASSAKEEELQPLLEIARVSDLIPTRTSSDDADNSKPDPDIVAAALKRTGCPADAAVMIGDTPYDVEAARRAGIRVVAFECGGWRRDELAGAVAFYRDAADLVAHYEQSVLHPPMPPGSPEVIVITGASAGVGRALVRRFAREGARIALLARGADGLEGARREVEQAGGKAIVLPTDVARWEDVDRAAAQTEEAFGEIDIWINNAMTSVFSPVREMRPEEYRRVTEVTYLGTVHGTLAALHRMLPRDRGTIVQVGSALAYRGIPLQSAYCAAKHATQGFMDSLHSELIHDGSRVRVSMVHLPAMNTPQFGWVKSRLPRKAQPVPPIYQPEIAAEAIFWAAHNDRRELWVGGPTVQAILADRVAPGLMDRYLGHMGYEAQQTGEPEDPNRADNLWQPFAGDHGAHGTFGDRAADRSPQLWAATHRHGLTLGALLGFGVGLAAMGLAAVSRRRDEEDYSHVPDAGLGPKDRAELKHLIEG